VDGLVNPPSPLATFYRFIPGCREPQRADRAAAGTLPTRGFRFCEALTSASAFGWYVFPPISFSLIWDGSEVLWTYEGAGDWHALKTAQFPGFASRFDEVVSPDLKGFSPPFLTGLREPGLVQIWSGLAVRTAPDWNLLVRQPANLVRHPGYECYEGIVETDRWFGPLFTNVRLTRTHAPIEFDADFPFLQVQPVHRSLYGSALDQFEIVAGLDQIDSAGWDAYRETVVKPNVDPERRPGQYAVAARRRRKGI
jgi:hypothetical protein